MTTLHLCPEGWRLYDLFVNGGIMWRVYLKHRIECGECTKPLMKKG